mgnify:FL=1
MTHDVTIKLTFEKYPTIQDILDYINDLDEDLDVEIKTNNFRRK